MLRVITMTSYRRPDYTRQVLAALSRCEGVANWLLLANVEPGVDEVIEQFRSWNACESRLIVNDERRGLNLNTQEVLVRAFKLRADIIVHLEDDTVPSPDALRYFHWAITIVLKSADDNLLLASGYNKPAAGPGDSHATGTRPIWCPWGWGVDRKRLSWLLSRWCTKNPKCFTCRIKQQYRGIRREIFPFLSRIQNIGYELGENDRTPQWYQDHHRSEEVAGQLPREHYQLPGNRTAPAAA